MEAGADALGFNLFAGSKRYLDLAAARDWLRELPATVEKVAVLVNPTEAEALRLAELPFIDRLQLHGQEPVELCRVLAAHGVKFSKAFPGGALELIPNASRVHTRTIILDALVGQMFGGTGQTFSWKCAREWVDKLRAFDVILAGGLTPENVVRAVTEVRPFGVDVTSGVEGSPGHKDIGKMRAFISAARAALAVR